MAKLKVSLPQLSINKKGPLISVMIQQQQQHQLQQRGGRGGCSSSSSSILSSPIFRERNGNALVCLCVSSLLGGWENISHVHQTHFGRHGRLNFVFYATLANARTSENQDRWLQAFFAPSLRINYIVFAFYCLLCNCKKAAQIKNRPFEKFNLILDQKVGYRKLKKQDQVI